MIRAGEIAQVISDSPLISQPFDHLKLKDIFPEAVYRSLLDHLPESSQYIELRHEDARLPDGNYARLEFELTNENLWRLDGARRRFLEGLANTLRSPDIRQAFATKFATAIHGRSVPPNARTTLRLSLIRDLPGYTISPHQDIPRKLITVQFYLPSGSHQSHFGTTFYRATDSGLERAVTLPFLPNSGYAFPVTTNSWHGVDPIETDTPRNSLMLIWYLDDGYLKLRALAEQAVNSVSRRLLPGGGR